jgi:formylglycine-generating enzyme required for sulfatase activity
MGKRGRGHRVRVAAFQLDVVRVTLDDYSRCGVNACPGMTSAEVRCKLDVSHPEFSGPGAAECVSYAAAEAFCRWHGGRLPTDVEWEYAARGTTGRRFAWGEGAFDGGQCATGERPPGTPCEVVGGTDDRSPFGVRELGTSGGEWTSTHHCPPQVPACGKVIRGATAVAWEWTSMPVDEVSSNVGFRCAYDLQR